LNAHLAVAELRFLGLLLTALLRFFSLVACWTKCLMKCENLVEDSVLRSDARARIILRQTVLHVLVRGREIMTRGEIYLALRIRVRRQMRSASIRCDQRPTLSWPGSRLHFTFRALHPCDLRTRRYGELGQDDEPACIASSVLFPGRR